MGNWRAEDGLPIVLLIFDTVLCLGVIFTACNCCLFFHFYSAEKKPFSRGEVVQKIVTIQSSSALVCNVMFFRLVPLTVP